MRIGEIEGSPQEIKDVFENNGLNLAEWIEASRSQKPRIRWVVSPVLLLLATLLSLPFARGASLKLGTSLFLVCFALSIWLSASMQLRYGSKVATAVVAVGSILLVLLASGFIDPLDVYNLVKEVSGKR